ncbi:hypothetical protein BJV74DRAFT_483301 [Russula compacta]|nr:hypothetical protein BJV74DRAFT_483301 [Russula compacta]
MTPVSGSVMVKGNAIINVVVFHFKSLQLTIASILFVWANLVSKFAFNLFHDISLARTMCNIVLLMHDGLIDRGASSCRQPNRRPLVL